MKSYRRFIRVGNDLIASPRFTRKTDAEEWYHQMRRKKQFLSHDLEIETSADDSIRFIDYARQWCLARQKEFPKATTYSDQQRLRDYILPLLSELPIASITAVQVRSVLVKISEPGYTIEGKSISPATVDRVKALMSVIFSDALNENPPLIKYNPVIGLKIKGKKKGIAKPRVLADSAACLKFIEAAKKIGWDEFVCVSLFLMTGLRKQELIALKWSCLDFRKKEIVVSEKFEQASNSIIQGTKAGENITRVVPIPDSLLGILKEHKKKSSYSADTDFILCRHDGRFHNARFISSIIEKAREEAKVSISAHGLRHTYGREFALKTGNIKALQAILGHSNSKTTDLYSELSGDRVRGFGEVVSFDVSVKRSTK